MREIRFHGRGGQGTVVATVILAKAYFKAGFWVQTFPVFGVERRGAPVEAYLRIDDHKILIRSNLYTPDHVVVQDARLLAYVDVTRGLKPGGWILFNAPDFPDQFPDGADRFAGYRLAVVDAARIAQENRLGALTQPIINTAMIGAFARIMASPPLDMALAAIRDEIPIKTEANIAAARKAYEQVRMRDAAPGAAQFA